MGTNLKSVIATVSGFFAGISVFLTQMGIVPTGIVHDILIVVEALSIVVIGWLVLNVPLSLDNVVKYVEQLMASFSSVPPSATTATIPTPNPTVKS